MLSLVIRIQCRRRVPKNTRPRTCISALTLSLSDARHIVRDNRIEIRGTSSCDDRAAAAAAATASDALPRHAVLSFGPFEVRPVPGLIWDCHPS